jgi:hypothetical protein
MVEADLLFFQGLAFSSPSVCLLFLSSPSFFFKQDLLKETPEAWQTFLRRCYSWAPMKHFLEKCDLKSLLVFTALLSLPCNCTHLGRQPYSDKKEISVLFNYVDSQARKVCISGSFNQWSTQSHCMVRKGDAWALKLSLPRGRYAYLFVVDDTVMKPDPGAILEEKSGFGMKNSILIVE